MELWARERWEGWCVSTFNTTHEEENQEGTRERVWGALRIGAGAKESEAHTVSIVFTPATTSPNPEVCTARKAIHLLALVVRLHTTRSSPASAAPTRACTQMDEI
jgi:hypothetical protein